MSVRVADWDRDNTDQTVWFNETEEVPDMVEFTELKSRVEVLEKKLDTMTRSVWVLAETVNRLRHEVEDAS